MTSVITNSFKIASGEYARILFRIFANKWWWVFAIVVIGIFSLSVLNINFIYVALMVMFIIIPMIMSFLYIVYGLVPESRLSILAKSAIINCDELELHFEDENGNLVKVEHILLESFSRYVPQKKWLLLFYKGSNYRFFIIPYDAFKSVEDLRITIGVLRKKLIAE
ncbi:MAG: hypothetical protein RR442_02920 [Muribaculaceae bacterium]